MPPVHEKPISVHTLVRTVVLVQVLDPRANQQASVGLFHTAERMENSLFPHVLCSCTRGLFGVGGLFTQPFSPLAEFAASVEVFCSYAQQDSPVGDGGSSGVGYPSQLLESLEKAVLEFLPLIMM